MKTQQVYFINQGKNKIMKTIKIILKILLLPLVAIVYILRKIITITYKLTEKL